MTAATDDAPTMSAAEYAVEVFKRTHRSGDAGQWERSDAVRTAIDGDVTPAPARGGEESQFVPGKNDGSYLAIERLWNELQTAGVPDIQIGSVAKYRNVARAWPEHERVPRASYDAHRELAGKSWDGNRKAVLRKLVDRKSSDKAIVTRNDVRVYKSEQKPPKSTSWEERFEKRVRSAFHSKDRPQARGEWQTAIGLLERLLAEAREASA